MNMLNHGAKSRPEAGCMTFTIHFPFIFCFHVFALARLSSTAAHQQQEAQRQGGGEAGQAQVQPLHLQPAPPQPPVSECSSVFTSSGDILAVRNAPVITDATVEPCPHCLFFPASDPSDPAEDPEPDQTSGVMPHTSTLSGCRPGVLALLPPSSRLHLKPRPLPGTAPPTGSLAPGSWAHGSHALPGSVFSLLTRLKGESRSEAAF